MNDDLQKAQLMIAVRALYLDITCDLHQILQEVLGTETDLSEQFLNHRLHQIANSVAWHESRRTPAARLQELARELARLWQKFKQTDEGRFYLCLVRRLGLQDELTILHDQIQRQFAQIERDIEAAPDKQQRQSRERQYRGQKRACTIEQQRYAEMRIATATYSDSVWMPNILLDFTSADQQRWHPTVRLWVALAVVQSLRLLVQSSDLRQAIQKNGGTLCP